MTVYQPREDTELLAAQLERFELSGSQVLEIGTGSGYIAVAAAKKEANVTAVDINPEAISQALGLAEEAGVEVEFIESDLFENVDGEYDLILFNPPYLPGEREGDEDALVGGKTGLEIIERFLSEVDNYMAESGVVLLVGSSHTDVEGLKQRFDLRTVDSRKLWFEELYILRKG